MKEKILELKNINLKIDNVPVIKNVFLEFYLNEICVIAGANASGKSVLMKILAGYYPTYTGEIILSEKKHVHISDINTACRMGTYMLNHEIQLIPNFTVEEYIFLGQEIMGNSHFFVNKKRHYELLKVFMDKMDLKIDVKKKVSALNEWEKRIVQILKALLADCKVLVLDEITENFTDAEVQRLFNVLQYIKKNKNVCIIYISYNLEKIQYIVDRVVIMKEGSVLYRQAVKGTMDQDALMNNIYGAVTTNRYPVNRSHLGRVVYRAQDLNSSDDKIRNVNFYVRSGEIFGITGSNSNDNEILSKMLAGIEVPEQGLITLDEYPVKHNVNTFIRKGIVYLDKDIGINLFDNMNIGYNISLPKYCFKLRSCLIDEKDDQWIANFYIDSLDVKNVQGKTNVNALCRGDKQKIAIAKWIPADARIYIFNEPTAHLDNIAKIDVYNMMNALLLQGKSIILFSTDLMELLGMSNRIGILRRGILENGLDPGNKETIQVLESVLEK